MANKDVVKKPSDTAVVKTKDGVIAGLEGITQDMLTIPRLKLVQKNSVEIDDKTAKPGEVVNSVTKEVICETDESLTIIPLKFHPTRLMFRDFGEGGGLLCQSLNGKTGRGEPGGNCIGCEFNPNPWPIDEKTGKGIPPPCTELINSFCIVRGYDFPIPLTASFGRTSMGAGKQLRNMIYFDAQKAQKNSWHFAYNLSTDFKENVKGTYFQFKIAPGGMAEKNEIKKGEEFYKLITSTQVEVHEDEDEIKAEQRNVEKKSKPEDEDKGKFNEDEENPFADDEE